MRQPLTKKARFDVFKRDAFCCQYCGNKPPKVVLEVDHIHPVAGGGDNSADNLITACFDCNRGKSDRLLSSVPQGLEERAALLAEKQEQIKAYGKLIKSIKRREDKSINAVQEVFQSHFGGFSFTPKFRESVRIFIQKMPIDDVEQAMHTACSRIGNRDASIKYFCGICWKTIRGEARA